ncbi:Predicted neuraminidase (sialidase) [Mariniphaga anaerophila]|uniref:Predicted neuraminidase (Sialidase) n=1 Tax=Mariniphaga anaerophila TaxID=1484053 RepID=A0A1M4ZWU8_9BACT|nr:sialidase family protein [Mariniphaga anaerophila]SHF22513.1 Predicted neuraminidase (sialidase) [Mariniphaga anaerophila]
MKTILTVLFFISSVYLFADTPFKGQKAVVKEELIYKPENVSFPSCHASTIAETKDGLVAAWFGGTHEKNPDVGIWVSRFVNGNWTAPVEVADGVQHSKLRYPTWNPVLFDYGDELFLFYKDGPNPRDWWGQLLISPDNGKTWSRRMRLPEEIYGPIKNKPELLSNGELICPTSTEHNGWQVHMEFTSDRGKTWERTEPINDGKELSAIQPSILKHPGGKLQILCRSRNKKILSAWSDDNGRTWSKLEPIDLPNPNSGTDAVTLKDGRHVLVYNHIDPSSDWGDRNILNVAVSNDGINWEAAVLLENDPDPDGEYSYPAVMQAKDGKIHITYTWNRKTIKHVVLDPSKFELRPIKDEKWPGA